jgi:hypothetical protein
MRFAVQVSNNLYIIQPSGDHMKTVWLIIISYFEPGHAGWGLSMPSEPAEAYIYTL